MYWNGEKIEAGTAVRGDNEDLSLTMAGMKQILENFWGYILAGLGDQLEMRVGMGHEAEESIQDDSYVSALHNCIDFWAICWDSTYQSGNRTIDG